MAQYICYNPPQTLELKVGQTVEVYEFPDHNPVEVSDRADYMLKDLEDDQYERVGD